MSSRDSSSWGVFRDVKPLWEIGGYTIKFLSAIITKKGNKVMLLIVYGGNPKKGQYKAFYALPRDLGLTPIKTKATKLKPLYIEALGFAITTL